MALTVTYNRTHVHSDFRTNHSNIGDQFAPDVLGLSDGGFVSAYNNPGSGIELQFYNAGFNGMLGLLPFDGITLAAGQPSLTQLANGNVLVVWDENDQTNDPDSAGLRGGLLSPTGAAHIGNELNLGIESVLPEDPQVVALSGAGSL